MVFGKMYNPGDVIVCNVQYTDTHEIKTRPALVLFEDMDNIIVAGITSNKSMKGVRITKEDGAVIDSVIKLNYIFTVSSNLVKKKVFSLNSKKKEEVYNSILNSPSPLKDK